MKEFITKMLSADGEISSKRIASLFVLLNVVVLAYVASFKNQGVLPEYMFNALCLIVGGGLGLTSLETIFKKKDEKKDDTPTE